MQETKKEGLIYMKDSNEIHEFFSFLCKEFEK